MMDLFFPVPLIAFAIFAIGLYVIFSLERHAELVGILLGAAAVGLMLAALLSVATIYMGHDADAWQAALADQANWDVPTVWGVPAIENSSID